MNGVGNVLISISTGFLTSISTWGFFSSI